MREDRTVTGRAICLLAVVLAVGSSHGARAEFSFVGVVEGFLTARHDAYYRLEHYSTPGSTYWWIAPSHTFELGGWDLQVLWLYRHGGAKSWQGPELWPSITLGKLSVDAEIRYLRGLASTPDEFYFYPTAMWRLDDRNSIGIVAAKVVVIDGDSAPYTIGPQWSYQISDEVSASVFTQQYVSGNPAFQLWVDFVIIPEEEDVGKARRR